MAKFSNAFIKTKLSKMPKNKVIVTYPGRFQPPTKNHYNAFLSLKEAFGIEPIVTTSNKIEKGRSPFTFEEKKLIWKKMFGVKRVEQVKLPYSPVEVLSKYPDDALWIVGLGEKDAERLDNWADLISIDSATSKTLIPWSEKRTPRCRGCSGVYYIIPLQKDSFKGKMISGTTVRETFRNGTNKEKKDMFVLMYGKMNDEIYNLINDRLSNLDEGVDWDLSELDFWTE